MFPSTRQLTVLTLLLAAGPTQAQSFETGFEGLQVGSLHNQNGWLQQGGAGGWFVQPYSGPGNLLGIPANPAGGARFAVARSVGGPTTFVKPVQLDPYRLLRCDFDVCVALFSGTPAIRTIGAVGPAPATSIRFNLRVRWTDPASPATWDADFHDAAGVTIPVPDPRFRNLPIDVWHRWGITFELGSGRVFELRITDGRTGATHVWRPAAPLPLLNVSAGMIPNAIALNVGGDAGNVLAVDNLYLGRQAEAVAYGAGCPSSLGAPPVLAAAPGSRPALGSTFVIQVTGMPASLAFVVTGLSDTRSSVLGAPLPAMLNGFGLTGCTLLADPLVVLPSSGTASLVVPGGIAFADTDLFSQAFVHDPGHNPAGFVTTNGLAAFLGK